MKELISCLFFSIIHVLHEEIYSMFIVDTASNTHLSLPGFGYLVESRQYGKWHERNEMD